MEHGKHERNVIIYSKYSRVYDFFRSISPFTVFPSMKLVQISSPPEVICITVYTKKHTL